MKLYERMHPRIRVSNLYSRFNEKCAKSIEKFVKSIGVHILKPIIPTF